MLKKMTALLMTLLLMTTALAEVYEGRTTALSSVDVSADSSGVLEALEVRPGERVEAGDVLARLAPQKVFSSQEGEVALIEVEEGQEADGTVLEVAPQEKYLIHCTVDKAYQAVDTTLIHSGEEVYIRCTTDGSHRAVGVVTQVDGAEYRVLTLGGELYVGETVYLYRDAGFTLEQRVGIGTVVSSDTEVYASQGVVTRMCVAPGDPVERGQLLYELDGGEVCAPLNGIVSQIGAEEGSGIEEDQVLLQIVPDGQVCVEIRLEEGDAAQVAAGQAALLTLADSEDRPLSGAVLDVTWVAEEGQYTVRILPEGAEALPLGMSVTVRF